jgi:hypothetical protein
MLEVLEGFPKPSAEEIQVIVFALFIFVCRTKAFIVALGFM